MTISSWLNFGRPGKGVCGGAKIFGSDLLQPARSVCVASERFFHSSLTAAHTSTVIRHMFGRSMRLTMGDASSSSSSSVDVIIAVIVIFSSQQRTLQQCKWQQRHQLSALWRSHGHGEATVRSLLSHHDVMRDNAHKVLFILADLPADNQPDNSALTVLSQLFQRVAKSNPQFPLRNKL